jgi:hypothetical protein
VQILYWSGFVLQLLAFGFAANDLRERKRLLNEYNAWSTPVTSTRINGWETKAKVPWSLLGRHRRETDAKIRTAARTAELATKQVALDLENTTSMIRKVSDHQADVLRHVMDVDWQAITAVVLGLLGFILGTIGGAPD